jgi:hypothetical protein
LVGLLSFATVALVVGQLRVRRYSGSHLVVQLTVLGRGLYVSRTADGTWLRLLVGGRRACGWPGAASDPPPDIGVREPRRPPGHDPRSGTAEVAPPEA